MLVHAAVYPKYPGEDAEEMLRRFKKALAKSDTSRGVRASQEFVSKSERRRRKSIRARVWQKKHGRHYHD